MALEISKSAIDLIVAEEVSSKAYYEKHYQRPEWPGVASGVTVGIGYDLGYATPAKIAADFGNKVSPAMLAAMQSCAGITGGAAQSKMRAVRSSILIPWNVAMDVFINRDVPQWIALVNRSVPNCNLLNSTCLGVLVSLAYNRGAGGFNSTTDRNREMRAIKSHMANKRFDKIPAEFRSMVRIWPGVKGLQGRRVREAVLFEKGLALGTSPVAKPPVTVPIDPSIESANRVEAQARTPQPTTTPAQNTTAGGIIAGGVAGATAAASSGMPISTVILIIVAAVVAAGGVWYAWYRNQNPK